VNNGDGTVTDTMAGLMWQRATAEPTYRWQGALGYCEDLFLAGYDDWRLPNRKELRSMVDYAAYEPAVGGSVFPDTLPSCYWSSTSRDVYADDAWVIHFLNGSDEWRYKTKRHNVRAVRGGQPSVPGHLFVLAPAQGSHWPLGEVMPVSWDTAGLGGNVRISISREGGIAGSFQTIAASTENDGAYEWTVTAPGSVNCMLKITPENQPEKGTTQGLFTIQSEAADPIPDIKVNGSDGPVYIHPGTPAAVTASLDPGTRSGEFCDWWVGALSPFGDYWLNSALNWVQSAYPIRVGTFGLFALPEILLFDHPLPHGSYTFFFLLDQNPNGQLDDMTWYDTVGVVSTVGAAEAVPDGVDTEDFLAQPEPTEK
jgi:hypothetical protein